MSDITSSECQMEKSVPSVAGPEGTSGSTSTAGTPTSTANISAQQKQSTIAGGNISSTGQSKASQSQTSLKAKYEPKRLEAIKKFNTTDTCAICLNVIDQPAVMGECLHFYCEQCVTKWLDKSVRCPLCKVVVPVLLCNIHDEEKFEVLDVNENFGMDINGIGIVPYYDFSSDDDEPGEVYHVFRSSSLPSRPASIMERTMILPYAQNRTNIQSSMPGTSSQIGGSCETNVGITQPGACTRFPGDNLCVLQSRFSSAWDSDSD